MSGPRARAHPAQLAALRALTDETRKLFHRLRVVAEVVHRQGELSAGRRGILMDLEQHGPQTVPQLARARPVSRQHIQMLVNGLLAEGLVERSENPAHQRSPFLQLTPRGTALIRAMAKAETQTLAKVPMPIPARDLEAATHVLRAVRAIFEGPHWSRPLRRRARSARRRRRVPRHARKDTQ